MQDKANEFFVAGTRIFFSMMLKSTKKNRNWLCSKNVPTFVALFYSSLIQIYPVSSRFIIINLRRAHTKGTFCAGR